VDSNHQRAYSTPPNSPHRNESFSRSTNIYRSHTESSIIINPQSSPRPPQTYVQTHSTNNPTPSTQGVLPSPSHPLSPMPSSTFERSPSIRRFEIIDALFNKGSPNIGVEAQASSSSAQLSTPMRHTTSLGSPRLNSPPSPHPRAVVKTPSWLASYPKAVESPLQPLSPLSSVDLPLHHFMFEESYEVKSSPRKRHITSASYSQSSVRNSCGHDVDPRSPLLDNTGGKIPELSSVKWVPCVLYHLSSNVNLILFMPTALCYLRGPRLRSGQNVNTWKPIICPWSLLEW